MSEVQVWKEYAIALQKQNNAKNQERDTLYQNLSKIQQQYSHILEELDVERQKNIEQMRYINQLEMKLKQVIQNCEQMHLQIVNKEQLISEIVYKKQELMQINNELEEMCDEGNKNIRQRDEELKILKQENKVLQAQILEIQQRKQNQEDIGVIIANYQKIQNVARELEKQNEILHKNNLYLEQQLIKLSEISSNPHPNLSDIPDTIQLVHQNNQLVQKIVQIQRIKNQYYAILKHNNLITYNITGVLRQLHTSNQYQPNQQQISIIKLKQENKTLIQNLKI